MRNAFSGSIRPNPASWSIWAFASILNLISYAEMTGDWPKVILPAACSVMNMITFLACLFKGRLRKLKTIEWTILIFDAAIVLFWWFSKSALYANLLLQVSSLISFLPLIFDVWKKPSIEKPMPWLLWTVGYMLLFSIVLLRWEKWEDAVYPLLCLILHGIVLHACTFKKVR